MDLSRLDRNFHMLLAALLFITAAVAVEIITLRHAQARDKVALRQECERVQSLEEIVNADTVHVAHADQAIGVTFAEPPVLNLFSYAERVHRLADVAIVRADIKGLLLLPGIDCHRAVYHPPYRQPPPVPLRVKR